jgi:hypothetical protein
MYYILTTDGHGPYLAKTIATANTSTQARQLALELDTALFGKPVGRVFYLDQESYIRWRIAGRVTSVDTPPVVYTSANHA